MKKQTKILLISLSVIGLGVITYFLLKKKPKITTIGINTRYTVQNKNWDKKGGYSHLYENGVADYFDKNGLWKFSSNESDSYLVINGIKYPPQNNDLPRQSTYSVISWDGV